MELNILSQLSQKMQIAPDFIIREYWEMILLKELSQSAMGQFLIFKGGTALRLAYNSPRFSEDLDFDLSKRIAFSSFGKAVHDFIDNYSNAKIKDLAQKYNTYLAQISFKDETLSKAFSIKIETSTRLVKMANYAEPRILTSPNTSTQVLIKVAKLSEIKKEKFTALKTRNRARDLFDLWYISQLERASWLCPKHNLSQREIKKELRKYLPRNYYYVLNQLIYEKPKFN